VPTTCTPRVGQIQRRLGAHAAALIGEIVGAIDRARLDEHDIERLQLMPDPRQLGLDLGAGHDMAVRAVRKIELHPRAKEEIERRLVDRRGGDAPLSVVE
jgi:hypothetical protein